MGGRAGQEAGQAQGAAAAAASARVTTSAAARMEMGNGNVNDHVDWPIRQAGSRRKGGGGSM